MPTIALLRKTAGTPSVFLQFSSVNVYDFDLLRQHIRMESCGTKDTLENINCDGLFGEAATSYISIIITVSTILSGVLAVFHRKSHLNPRHLEAS